MEYITNDDINTLTATSTDKLNLVLAGMTILMDDTNQKVSMLENQTWFERMSNTITGKSKMTVEEIAQNRDKVNCYLSEAISALYDQNMLDHRVILGLGNKLNSLYDSHVELKQMLGAFVDKLNKKIESIDNFHMLMEEINQHLYNSDNRIAAICQIVSQLDTRTIHDDRKMDILQRAMEQNSIFSDDEQLFVDFMTDILDASENDAGVITLMLDSIKDDYVAEITGEVIQSYYFLPDRIRKMKSKKAIVEAVLNEKQIDLEYKIVSKSFYIDLVKAISNTIVVLERNNEEDLLRQKKDKVLDYLNSIETVINMAFEMIDSWAKICVCDFYNNHRKEELDKWYYNAKQFTEGKLYEVRDFYSTLNKIEDVWQYFYSQYSDKLENFHDSSGFGFINPNGTNNFGCGFEGKGNVLISEYIKQETAGLLEQRYEYLRYKYQNSIYDEDLSAQDLQTSDVNESPMVKGYKEYTAYFNDVIKNLLLENDNITSIFNAVTLKFIFEKPDINKFIWDYKASPNIHFLYKGIKYYHSLRLYISSGDEDDDEYWGKHDGEYVIGVVRDTDAEEPFSMEILDISEEYNAWKVQWGPFWNTEDDCGELLVIPQYDVNHWNNNMYVKISTKDKYGDQCVGFLILV